MEHFWSLLDQQKVSPNLGLVAIIGLLYLLDKTLPMLIRKLQGKNSTATLRGALDHLLKDMDSVKTLASEIPLIKEKIEVIPEIRHNIHDIRDKLNELALNNARLEERVRVYDRQIGELRDYVERQLAEVRSHCEHTRQNGTPCARN